MRLNAGELNSSIGPDPERLRDLPLRSTVRQTRGTRATTLLVIVASISAGTVVNRSIPNAELVTRALTVS